MLRENKNYIKKRKPINITLDDLDAIREEDDDEEFKVNVALPTDKRTLPGRECTKDKAMNVQSDSEDSD